MRRDKALVPLSRQHQHALALCVRIDRAAQAGAIDLEAWQAEIQQQFEQEINAHFAAEERDIFPAARKLPELQALVDELLAEHASLRRAFSSAENRALSVSELQLFAKTLSGHIRKEERELFEKMQVRLTADELGAIGVRLNEAVLDIPKTCGLPSPARMLKQRP